MRLIQNMLGKNKYNYIRTKGNLSKKKFQCGLDYTKGKYNYIMTINSNILLPSNWINDSLNMIEKVKLIL